MRDDVPHSTDDEPRYTKAELDEAIGAALARIHGALRATSLDCAESLLARAADLGIHIPLAEPEEPAICPGVGAGPFPCGRGWAHKPHALGETPFG